ncbi:uncharacterized protein LOC131939966 [Physella acuta]|uniref:uncharacterized protein LOC131939966 n=1 Tax=Physella acuta TaxID=109671 RepID=UPI0027DB6F88|nr:uncharacterized protein LOC131939966 [Physella acuta]
MISDLDVVKNELLKRQSETRRKRSLPALAGKVLSKAARTLFKSARAGRVTTSGACITRQYQRFGNFNDALRDFNRFRPDNLKSFNGKISGRTGTVGKHRITVRNGSSNGSPALEIRSYKARGEYVRKFRYYNP